MSSLNNLQECLLYAFSGNIPCYGSVLTFSANFVNFINEDYSSFSSGNITTSGIYKLEKHIFNVFTNISSFSEGGCIGNCKRNIKLLCKCLCKECFSRSCWSKQEDV